MKVHVGGLVMGGVAVIVLTLGNVGVMPFDQAACWLLFLIVAGVWRLVENSDREAAP